MSEFKQTWWDNNLDKRFSEFETWVGPSSSTSKVYFRKYVKKGNYKTLIDLGCGNATEFEAYKEEYPELLYLGVDGSKFLNDRNSKLGIPMVHAPGDKTGLIDNHSEVVFSRHVLEHQPTFKPVLEEMIRLASKVAIHVFFIPPGDTEHIGYDSSENLYHNRYIKKDIEEYLLSNEKVDSFEWVEISEIEVGLMCHIKRPL